MELIFWTCAVGVLYAYFGYPLVLMLLGLFARSADSDAVTFSGDNVPDISILIPAHNEAGVIRKKLENTLSLYYPGQVQIVIVSDGSTDETSEVVNSFGANSQLTFLDLSERRGKANALNAAVELARGDILVFSDASILLDEQALWEIVQPFADHEVGCVSGEDLIAGGGGEGLYGRYELFLRRQESKVGSIVGASGSFYAQRKDLVTRFPEGVAPDFLSVLNTVERGFRAISVSTAFGYMTAVSDPKGEFRRKTRTVIRGMTALFGKKTLLNPVLYPTFSFFLLSHKIIRWLVPFFLLGIVLSNLMLMDGSIYQLAFVGQLMFYGLATVAFLKTRVMLRIPLSRVALYFTVSNLAIFIAWFQYFTGVRQEIWTPSERQL